MSKSLLVIALAASAVGALGAMVEPLMPGSWSGPIAMDIGGTGFAQVYANTLDGCKEKCQITETCQAAQWSATDEFENNNCFLFNTQAIDAAQFKTFNIYKFNPKGCSGSAKGCCLDNVENKPTLGGCNCGSPLGCCADGVTPQVTGVSCPDQPLPAPAPFLPPTPAPAPVPTP